MPSRKAQQSYTGKAKEINLVLSEPNVDLWKLRELALGEGGLVNDDLRRRAWPKLVGLHDNLFQDRRAQAVALSQDNSSSSSSRSVEFSPKISPKRVSRKSLGSSLGALSVRRDSREGLSNLAPQKHHSSKEMLRSMHRNSETDDEHSVASGLSVASSRDRILAICDDFEQIERDVGRCTWHLLTGNQRSVAMQMEHKRHRKIRRLIRRKQRRLANLINLTLQESYSFLRGEQKLRYYQGYHDVACLILSTLGGSRPVSVKSSSLGSGGTGGNTSGTSLLDTRNVASSMGLDMPSAVLLQLSQSHFADCMKANFLQLQTALRLTLFPLIAFFDPQVHAHLYECEMEPYFALSWVITWFSHDIRDTAMVKRLFDFFLVSHPLMPIYTSVAMILHPLNRQEVIKTECDFALMHQTLQGLPRNSSMVGWKYRPGDGYVSDDEEDDDEDEEATVASHEILESDLVMIHDASSAATTGGGGGNGDDAAVPGAVESNDSSHMSALAASSERVPFEELIDKSIYYMRRLPPRNLIGVATKYYGKDFVDQLLHKAPGISFLETVPDWAVACSAKADWVLQQRAREEQQQQQRRGGSVKNRNRGKNRRVMEEEPVLGVSGDGGGVEGSDAAREAILAREDSEMFVREHKMNRAVIAAGFGSGDDPERYRRKRRRMMLAGAVAVAVLAILVGIQRDQAARAARVKVQQPVGEIDITVVADEIIVVVNESSSSPSSLPSLGGGCVESGPSSLPSSSAITTTHSRSVATFVADSDESDPSDEVQLVQEEIVSSEEGLTVSPEDLPEETAQPSMFPREMREQCPPGHHNGLEDRPDVAMELLTLLALAKNQEETDAPVHQEPPAPAEVQEETDAPVQDKEEIDAPFQQDDEPLVITSRKDWRDFAKAMRQGLKARRDKKARRRRDKQRRNGSGEVLLISDRPAWANAVHAVQVAVGQQVALVGGFLDKAVKRKLVASSDVSLRVLDGIMTRLILHRDVDSLVHLQRKLAVVLKERAVHEGAMLREKLGDLKHNVRPHWRKISKGTREKLHDVRHSLSSKVGKRAKRALGDTQGRSRKEKRGGTAGRKDRVVEEHEKVQPRLQSLSSASTTPFGESDPVHANDGLIRELQDVSFDLKVSAAAEEAVYVLQKIGDFPVQKAVLDVARFEFSNRLTQKLSMLVRDLNYDSPQGSNASVL